jgi:hypothetical protein
MKNVKKTKTNTLLKYKTSIFIAVVIPCIFFGVWYKVVLYLDLRDRENFSTGYEVGRFEQLIENYEEKASESLKITPKFNSNPQANTDIILKRLAQIESRSGEVRKLLDTNNKYSLGLYHFQAYTVKDMYKRYYGKNISITEAVEIAENDELATKLAHEAIFIKGEKFHWHNSMKKMTKEGLISYK